MATSQHKTRPSRAEFVRRFKRLILPALAVILLAGAAGAYALARVVEADRPNLALALMPSLAPALTARAEAVLVESGNGRDRAKVAEARSLAQRALLASPLDPAALRMLAGTGPQRPEIWRPIVQLALRVSRRDVGAQMVQIEVEVARNDAAAALRHYDQALRVRPSTGAALYPIMLAATDTPDMRAAVRQMVSRGPPWLPGLINWTVDNPDYLKRLARIVGAFPAGAEALAPGYGQSVVEALVQRRELPEAFQVYAAYARQGAVPGFGAGFTYRPIDWTVADNYNSGSDLVESPSVHVRFFAEPGQQGVFLSRLAALEPGRYRILVATEKPADDAAGTVTLQASCQLGREDRGFARATFPVATGRYAHEFTVPPQSCPFQWLRFSVASRQGSVAAILRRIEIIRIGERPPL